MPQHTTIGIDLGTSGLRVVALDETGRVTARARRNVTTARPETGAAEQCVADWWSALESALSTVALTVPTRTWHAIGLSAMLPTLVAREPTGSVRLPAITWEDNRAETDGTRFTTRIGDERLYRTTGQRVDGRYLLPMAARLRRLGQIENSTTVIGAKDYLFERLTGLLATDPSTATGYGAFDLLAGTWNREFLAAAGDPPVPDIAPSDWEKPLLDNLADHWNIRRGTPVTLGAADSILAAYGLGATDDGDIAYIAGTSTAIIGHHRMAVFDSARRYLVTPAVPAGFGLETDLLSTGSGFTWLAGILGLTGPADVAALASTLPASDTPIILPYLAPGEQGTLWSTHLTGAIVEATLATTRADIARSLQTAIIVESRRCISVLTDSLGSTGTISVSGSSAQSSSFRQDLADATGHQVKYTKGESDHSAVGAALLAAHSIGMSIPGLTQEEPEILDPKPDSMPLWTHISQRYDHISACLSEQP